VLSQVVELIENKHNFAITTHVDRTATESARRWVCAGFCALSAKRPKLSSATEIPVSYASLPGADEIRKYRKLKKLRRVFVIECSDIDRPGIKGLENQFTVNIDHHATSEHFGTINWIDATASAVGEMIYNLCKAIGGRVTKEIAECVYMALVTDTGSFHFPNTTDRTLKVASELVKVGVKPAQISEAVYNSYPWSRIELMRQVLNTVKRDQTGRVAWMRQTLEMRKFGNDRRRQQRFRQYSARRQRSRSVVYMREVEPNFYRVSLRSKDDINVARVAEKFGGGGHKNAAGCRVEGDWDECETEIVAALTEAVEKAHDFAGKNWN
jgi:phosphoesterase RecJ-like protein